jgi:hypothetical protein
MRQGLRARGPARADRATEFRTPAQTWGEPAWFSDPWLQFGSAANQNSTGAIHCAGTGSRQDFTQSVPWEAGACQFTGSITSNVLTVSAITSAGPGLKVGQMVTWNTSTAIGEATYITSLGSGTGGTGTYNVSSIGNQSSKTMWSRHPWANRDGGMGWGRVADPVNPERWCHVTRIIRDDNNADTQRGRKMMPRTEGFPTGELKYADMMLTSFALMVPSALREMHTGGYYTEDGLGVCNRVGWGMGANLIYQGKTGMPIQGAMWLCARGYRSPNQAGPYFEWQVGDIPTNRHIKVGINFPADTWIHFIQLQRHGIRPWSSGLGMATGRFSSGTTWAQVTHLGRCYMVVSGGDGTSGTASNTAPTHTSSLPADDVPLDGAQCNVNDWCTRTDLGANFRLDATPSTSAGNWTNIGGGTGSGANRGSVADEISMRSLRALRWRYLGTIGDMSADPRVWMWMAIGDGAYSLVVNGDQETNIGWPDTVLDDPNKINTQWGWYTAELYRDDTFDVFGAGDSGPIVEASICSYPNAAWTASTDGVNVVTRNEMATYWKGPISAKPVIANQYRNSIPTDRLLSQWFDVLRSR